MTSAQTKSNKKIKVFAGRYAYVKPLGRGAGGSVYLAKDLHRDNRRVALKVLTPEACATVQGKMLRREFEILSKLNHPNMVRVYDYGSLPDGGVFLAEEYIDGFSLQDARALISPESLIDLTMQILNGLSYVHGMGMIHRDIKPANVMLLWLDDETADPKAKLVDFGLSSMDPKRDTLRGGTRSYMAPEIIRGEKGEPQSDLFSLGVTLYYALCGVLPFGPRTKDDPPPTDEDFRPPEPHRLNSDVPLTLSRFTMALLRQVDDVLFMDAGEAMQALARDVETEGVGAGSFANNMQVAAPQIIRGYFERGVIQGHERHHSEIVEVLTREPDPRQGGVGYLLVGEPQTGKSRLIREISTSCKLRGRVVVDISCYEGMKPWALMSALLTRCHEITRHRKVNPLNAYTRPLAMLKQSMHMEVEQELLVRQHGQWIARAFDDASTMLHDERVMLCIEDLQLGDQHSVEYIKQWLATQSLSRRLDVVTTLSPHSIVDEFAQIKGILTVSCAGLTSEDVHHFLSSRLGLVDVPNDFVRAVSERAKGQPAYFEEVCRHLVDDGVLTRPSADSWDANTAMLSPMMLPQSLQESFRRRMTTSGAAGRELLEVLTLSKDPLPWSVLRDLAVSGGESLDSVERGIDVLRWRHLIQIDLDMSGRIIRLVHPAVRDVVGGLLSPDWARALQRRLGSALLDRWMLAGGNVEQAALSFERGGRGIHAAKTALHTHDYHPELHDILEVEHELEPSPDHVLFELKRSRYLLGRFDRQGSQRAVERALEYARAGDLPWLTCQAHLQAIYVALAGAQLESATNHITQVAHTLPTFYEHAAVLEVRAHVAMAKGLVEQATSLATAMSDAAATIGDTYGRIRAGALSAEIAAMTSNSEVASKCLQSTYDLASTHGMTHHLGRALIAHARLLIIEHSSTRALKLFGDAMDTLSLSSSPVLTLSLLWEISCVAMTEGQIELARRSATECLLLSKRLAHAPLTSLAVIAVKNVSIHRGVGDIEDHIEQMANAYQSLASSDEFVYDAHRAAQVIRQTLEGMERLEDAQFYKDAADQTHRALCAS